MMYSLLTSIIQCLVSVPCLCGSFLGTVSHYISGLAISDQLQNCLDNSLNLLSSTPHLLPPVMSTLQNIDDWVALVLDQVTNGQVIEIKQIYGDQSIWPLYRLSRAMIWCMHLEREKLMS